MIPILTDLRNTYEAHDREAFDRHLKRLEGILRYTGPVPQSSTPQTSDERAGCESCMALCRELRCNDCPWL